MKYILILLIIITSCRNTITPYKKPFVIICKQPSSNYLYINTWLYTYRDANNIEEIFYDTKIYNVGDTIK